MKLQPESKKELLRIACGVSLCTAVMWVVFAALHLVGWVVFDYRVLLGGIIGALVAIGNFAGICFVVQKVIDEQMCIRDRFTRCRAANFGWYAHNIQRSQENLW